MTLPNDPQPTQSDAQHIAPPTQSDAQHIAPPTQPATQFAQPGAAPASTSTGKKPLVIALVGLLTLVIVLATLLATNVLSSKNNDGGTQANSNTTQTQGETQGEGTNQSDSASQSDAANQGNTEAGVQVQPVTAEQKQFIDSLARRDPADPKAKGDVNAKIVVKIYADFRCVHCANYTLDVEPQLAEHLANGDIRYEFESFPILGAESDLAAQAAEAAALQGKFWEYHDALFQGFANKSIIYTDAGLIQLAQAVGVPDLAKFQSDMKSQAVRDSILKSTQTAQSIGLTGTPAFIIGYTGVPSGLDFPTLDAIIKAELAR